MYRRGMGNQPKKSLSTQRGIYLEHLTVQGYEKDLGQPKETLLIPEEQMVVQLGHNDKNYRKDFEIRIKCN